MSKKTFQSRHFIIGCDPSSKKLAMSATIWGSPNYQFSSVTFGSRFDIKTCGLVDEVVESFLQACHYEPLRGDIGSVYIEEPVYGRNIRSAIVQSYVLGAVAAAFYAKQCDVNLVGNTDWKKRILNKGNASKDEIATAILTSFAPVIPFRLREDQDILDSMGILQYGISIEKMAMEVAGA